MDAAHAHDALQRLSDQLQASLREWRQPARRQQIYRPELLWLLCWQLKDLGWVLLCGPLAWSAGLLAIAVEGRDLQQQMDSMSVAELVHSLAIMSWLCGSVVWMTAQLLFEPVIHQSRASPWYSGALLIPSAHHYDVGTTLMQVIEGAALVGVFGFYASTLIGFHCLDPSEDYAILDAIRRKFGDCGQTVEQHTNRFLGKGYRARRFLPAGSGRHHKACSASSGAATPERSVAHAVGSATSGVDCEEDSGLIFGFLSPSVYAKTFIVPWMLKDLFWSIQWFMPTLLCMLLAIALMADYFWLSMKWKNAAGLIWAAGSTVWICNDMVMAEQEAWPLLLTILLFTISCCMLSSAIITMHKPEETECIDDTEEQYPLL